MAKSIFKLPNFERYAEQVEQAGLDILDAAEAAVVAGADVILAGMLKRVPIDTHNLAAHLAASEPEFEGDAVFVTVGLLDADADTARYGNVQEYGSSSMGAQPYVRPAFSEDRTKALSAMRKALSALIGE